MSALNGTVQVSRRLDDDTEVIEYTSRREGGIELEVLHARTVAGAETLEVTLEVPDGIAVEVGAWPVDGNITDSAMEKAIQAVRSIRDVEDEPTLEVEIALLWHLIIEAAVKDAAAEPGSRTDLSCARISGDDLDAMALLELTTEDDSTYRRAYAITREGAAEVPVA